MSALTSLLVRDRVVPVKKIEEAIQRQVISGGALDTVLLEVGATAENVLASYCAAVFELAPASAAQVMEAAPDVVKMVPREVAEQHRIVPIEASAGKVVLAVHEPLHKQTEEQLGFLLGAKIEQRIVTQARIEAALGAHYGVELSPRLRRLSRKLGAAPVGELSSVAPLDDNRRTMPGEEPDAAVAAAPEVPTRGVNAVSADPLTDAAEASSVAEPAAPASAASTDNSPDVSTDGTASASASAESIPSSVDTGGSAGGDRISHYGSRSGGTTKYGQVPDSPRTNTSVNVSVTKMVGAQTVERTSIVESAQTFGAKANPSGFAEAAPAARQTEAHGMERPEPTELLSRIRGPFTARLAVELLEQAETREDVLQVALRFVAQFFDSAVLFMVHDDVAEGLDVEGEGPDYTTVRRTSVSVEEAGILSDAYRMVTPRMGDLKHGTRSDLALAEALGRSEAQPCIVAPVSIRQRVVLLFYADRNGEDFGISDVPEFVAFMPRVSEAFQRLILRRKVGKAPPSDAAPDAGDDTKGTTGRRWQGGRRNWVPEVSHTPRARAPKRRTQAMDVLGVPRTAPPPPSPVANAVGRQSVSSPEVSAEAEASSEDPEPAYVGVPAAAVAPVVGVPVLADGDDTPDMLALSVPPAAYGDTPSGSTVLEGAEAELEDFASPLPPPADDSASGAGAQLAPAPAPSQALLDAAESLEDAAVPAEALLRKPAGATTASVSRDPAAARPLAGVYSMRGTTDVVGTGSRSSRPPPPRESQNGRAEYPNQDKRVPSHGLPAVAAAPFQSGPEAAEDDEPELTITPANAPRGRSSGALAPRVVVDPGMPSVILDLGDGVESTVQQLLTSGPEEMFAVQAAQRAGVAVLPALVREFPGPLWFDRHAPHQRLPRGRDVSAVARAMVAFGDTAVPYVAALLDREDHDVRFYATLLAAEISHRDLVGPLGRRVFDVDSGTRALALDVLRPMRRFQREFGRVIDRVRANARIPARPLPIRVAAVKALGHLRDEGAVDLLVRLLDVDESRLVSAAHQSLMLITRQDFGRTRNAWIDWVADHRGEHRIEWLIDALMHDDSKIRRLAGDELKHLTQAYYGYHHALPKRDREVAQRKYRDWWANEGRTLFAAG